MLLRRFHDAQSHLVQPLGKDHGGRVRLRLITQSHRHMGGVSDDHIRLRHLLHHAGLGHFSLGFLDFALDLRIAFGLFIFLLDLLLRHAHLPFVIPPLIVEIKACQSNERNDNLENHAAEAAENIAANGSYIRV